MTEIAVTEETKILADVESKPDLMEKLIFQLMFKNSDIRESLIPYLDKNIFRIVKSKKLYSIIEGFMEDFQEFPTIKDVKLRIDEKDSDVKEYLSSCFETQYKIEDFNKDHIINTIEAHVRKALYSNVVVGMLDEMNDYNFKVDSNTDLPERLREICSFSFDTNVGLDLFSEEGIERMVDFFHQSTNFVPSGISGLDKMLGGGFHSKSLNLFMLPTNKGKSAIMGALGANQVLQGKNVLYITLEMSEEMIAHRIMSNIFDITLDSIKGYAKDTLIKKYKTIADQCKGRFRVKEYPTSTMNSNTIRRLIKEYKDKQGWEPDIIYVDYLGLMKPNRSRKVSQKHEDLKTVSEELRDIGLEYDIPIVSAMQTNREGFDSADLSLSDMSESFGVAMTADVTIAGIMNDELKSIGEYIWRIVKNRFGQNNQEINVGIDFPKMKLTDLGQMPRNVGEAGDMINTPSSLQQPQSLTNMVNNANEKDNEDLFERQTGFSPRPNNGMVIKPDLSKLKF
jgi:archaellum biogenesis ATPase FlaH